MNKLNSIFILFALHFSLFTFAQEDSDDGMIATPQGTASSTTGADNKYLEDQFYLGLTYDYLAGKASNVVQHNLSRSIFLGYLRDLPINQKRNVGFAIGIGYAYDLIYNNMVANKTASGISYEIVENFKDYNISRNFFETHTVEIPIEFRYRTSTPQNHKFWRIYAGARFGYIFSGKSLYTANDVSISFQNNDIARTFQVKPFITFGYNALNFFVQYNITPLLKDAKTSDGTSLKANVLQIGLIFYIL